MKLEKRLTNLLLFALALFCIASCKKTPDHIPFPENETDFPQPVSKPLKFSDVKKIIWTKDVKQFKPEFKPFDFNRLPEKIYDSSGFIPFARKPDSVKFDFDKLPDTAFDYNKLPSIPLKFETSLLETPQLIRSGPPRLIDGNTNLIFQLGESQGLESQYINSIFEDKTGFLWIATDKGLYRYDGTDLLLYAHLKADFLIFNMIEDSHGQIWIGSRDFQEGGNMNNLSIINPQAGIIKRLANSKGFGNVGEVSMLLDNTGKIWVKDDSGVNIIDENSGIIVNARDTRGWVMSVF